MTHQPVVVTQDLDDAVRDIVAMHLREGEVVVGHTLIVSTRYVDTGTGEWVGRRLRYVADGCDPHLALGWLEAEAAKLRQEIA